MKRKLLAAFLAFGVLLSGCSVDGKEVYVTGGSGRHNIFKIESLACTEQEAKVYLANDKNIYGVVMGNSLWTEEYDTDRMSKTIKDAVLKPLIRVYALNLYAAANGISLEDAELSKTERAAADYYASLNDAERSYMDVTEEDIRGMYERYALAVKVYGQLMESVDEEVSEDEARVMRAQVFYVESQGEADSVARELAAGDSDFSAIAERKNAGEDPVEAVFTRNTYPAAVEDVVFRMENDQVSDAIEADGRFYFVKCIEKYDAELSEANKQNVIKSRKDQVLRDIIDRIGSDYYSVFNQVLWNSVSLPQDPEQLSALQTDSFFAHLDENMTFN